jgi:hypothetical protein
LLSRRRGSCSAIGSYRRAVHGAAAIENPYWPVIANSDPTIKADFLVHCRKPKANHNEKSIRTLFFLSRCRRGKNMAE